MQDISKGEGRTVLFVSHNMGSINKLCSKGILLENGIVINEGAIDKVVDSYLFSQKGEINNYFSESKDSAIFIKEISIKDSFNQIKDGFFHNEKIRIETKVIVKEKIPEAYVLLTILDKNKRKLFSAEKKISKTEILTLEIKENFLTRGFFSIQAIVYKPAIGKFDFIEDACTFQVIDAGSNFTHLETFDYGTVFGQYSWV